MPAKINDVKSFEETIKSSRLSIIHFAADFAEQCKQVDEVLDLLGKQADYSMNTYAKCQAEELSEVSLKYQIIAVPTVILFKSGKQIDRIDGADPAKLTATIKEHSQPNGEGKTKEALEVQLKALINKANVMLFMKGDRQTPRCGFSRTIIEILNNTGVPYQTFDILSDEGVRQGLKTFSDWPTYPQLYVKGELIGGLDIVKEMLAGGELESALKA